MRGYVFNKRAGWYDGILDWYDGLGYIPGQKTVKKVYNDVADTWKDVQDARQRWKDVPGSGHAQMAGDAVVRTMNGEQDPGIVDKAVDAYNTGVMDIDGVSDVDNTGDAANRVRTVVKQRTKANLGWVKDQNGNFRKATPEEYSKQIQNLQESRVKPGDSPQRSGFKGYIEKKYTSVPNTRSLAAEGAEQGVKESLSNKVVEDPITYAPIAASSWFRQMGWDTMAEYAKKPGWFWGGIAAGVIGIPLLIRSFFGGGSDNNNKAVTININNGQGGYTPTTSFWRHNA